MNKENKLDTRVITPEFRVSFPAIFKAKMNEQSGQAKYSVVMLFKKTDDISALKTAASNAVKNLWPDATTRPKNLHSPFRDGNEKQYDGYKDMTFITASSVDRPGLVDEDVQPIIDEAQFYAGCYARATVRAYAYSKAGNNGVAFAVHNIQKTKDGEKFGGGKSAAEDFAPIARQGAVGEGYDDNPLL